MLLPQEHSKHFLVSEEFEKSYKEGSWVLDINIEGEQLLKGQNCDKLWTVHGID